MKSPTPEVPQRRLLLEPKDYWYVGWKPRPPSKFWLPTRPFQIEECLSQLKETNGGCSAIWVLAHPEQTDNMSREEAHFWLEAAQYPYSSSSRSKKDIYAYLNTRTFDGSYSLEQLLSTDYYDLSGSVLARIVWPIFGVDGIAGILKKGNQDALVLAYSTVELLDYLTPEEQHSLGEAITPLITASSPSEMLCLAAATGAAPDILREVVASWPDGSADPTSLSTYERNTPISIIAGLADAPLISKELRRLKAFPNTQRDASTIIAATEFSCIDFIVEHIRNQDEESRAESLTGALIKTASPETAVALATVATNPRTTALAQEWWIAHPYFAIQGLAPLIQEPSERGKTALFWLCYLQSQQGRDYFEQALHTLPDDIVRQVCELVLEAPPSLLPAASGALTDWLEEPVSSLPPKNNESSEDPERRVNARTCLMPVPLATSFTLQPAPVAPVFDLGTALSELAPLRSDRYWDFDKKRFTFPISPQEAHFWLAAQSICRQSLSMQSFTVLPLESLEEALSQLTFGVNYDRSLLESARSSLIIPAWTLFGVEGLLRTCTSVYDVQTRFSKILLPYLSGTEREAIADRAFQTICANRNNPSLVPGMLELMATLPVSAELYEAALLEADNIAWDTTYENPMLPLLLKLPDPARVVEIAVEKSIYPNTVDEILQWLSVTAFHGTAIARERAKELSREERVRILSSIEAPEVAPEIAALRKFSTSRVTAESWLDSFPAFAIEGLVPLLVEGDPKRVELAATCLGELDRKGHRELIVGQRARSEPSIQTAIDQHVLSSGAEKAIRPNKKDLELARQLPTVVIYQETVPYRLTVEQTAWLLAALRTTSLSEPSATLERVRRNADRATLDRFLWILFLSWRHSEMPNRERWKFEALGHLGGDTIARQLTDNLLHLPYDEKKQGRIKMGLECLRSIGSVVALQEIRKLYGSVGSGPFQNRVGEYIRYLVAAHNQASDEDVDRFTPDAGLDLSCSCTFDLGAREFTLCLAPDLIPVFKDKDGKPRTALPKAGKFDSRAKAKKAMKTWEEMEVEITVARGRARHLQRAQQTKRRWTPGTFYRHLVKHPLLGLLIQGILWATYDTNGSLLQAFRVTEHRTLADDKDAPWNLPDDTMHIGIVHPDDLSHEQQELWLERLSDYEIFPPFVQFEKGATS